MSDITVTFKNETILTMDASGSKDLLTQGKYCEDDISITYVKPGGGGGGSDTLGEWVADTLVNYTNSDLTTLRSNALSYSGDSLQTVSLPNVVTIGANALRSCKARHIYTPSAQSGTGTCWNLCSNLETLALPSWVGSWIADQMWNDCTALTAIDFGPNTADIGRNNLFQNDTNLATVIIRSASVIQLRAVASFNNTPFASGGTGGTLYVPQALIASYQAATNWSTILGYANNRIQAIEGSIYENAYADGTPIT